MSEELTPEEYRAEMRRLRAELEAANAGRHLHAVPKPPPLRQAEVIRALLSERHARASSQARGTVRLTRNAKGDTQIEVLAEVNAESGEEAVARAMANAREVYDALALVYGLGDEGRPPPAGNGGEA